MRESYTCIEFGKRGGRNHEVTCPSRHYFCGNCGSCIRTSKLVSHQKQCF